MDEPLIPAYYAGKGFMSLPFAPLGVALRYISEKGPTFLIVRLEDRKKSRPYLARWFDEGIPEQRAELICYQVVPHRERLKIHRWEIPHSPPRNTCKLASNCFESPPSRPEVSSYSYRWKRLWCFSRRGLIFDYVKV